MNKKPIFNFSVLCWRRLFFAAVSCCALLFLPSLETRAESSPGAHDEFQRQLLDRAEQYLASIHNHAVALPDEERKRLVNRAQDVVQKGFWRLRNPSKLVGSRPFDDFDPSTVLASLRQLEGFENNPSLRKAAEFLGHNFYRPSELEVAVRVALPNRFEWEKRFGILANHRPFSGSIFGSGCFGAVGCSEMVVSPNRLRDLKSWLLHFDSVAFLVLPFETGNVSSRRNETSDLLSGFHVIAQTIVLRT